LQVLSVCKTVDD